MKACSPLAAAITLLVLSAACASAPSDCGPAPSFDGGAATGDPINLADALDAGRLRKINRDVTPVAGGNGVRLTAHAGIGLVWIEGTDFANGTIEADVCGRDVAQESFVGIAFHRQDDETYEAVYLRPFNFRNSASDRRQHAAQYIALPGNDYDRLRARFPGEFEKAVDPSVAPAAWNRLRVVTRDGRVQAYVGNAESAALDVRALQTQRRGQLGLFLGNGSDGVFANLRIVRTF